jgi:predicted SAM-dependent methyltransferase
MQSLIKVRRKFAKLVSRYGFGAGRGLSVEQHTARGLILKRLHLGCGHVHLEGWTNVDALRTGATDVVCDITTLPGIASGSVDQIYACHVLEHFAHDDVNPILSRWYEVLGVGGELRISVPDLDAITRIYQQNLPHFQVPGHAPWIALIYGGQKDQFDFHKTGFNYCWLRHLLGAAGFIQIKRYPNAPHFVPGTVDNSLALEPFGEYISLNVIATK